MASGSTKAILAAMFANFGISIAKFVAYLFTSSSSMLAESIHSVADTSNQALLLLGSRRANKHATAEHPFGYGRERYFWAFIVALVLFTLGGLFAMYEGWHKLQEESHGVSNAGWAIGVLVLGLFLEGYSFRTAVKESLPFKGASSWWEFIRHSRSPELPVVLLEDAGALIGLVLALGGVSLTLVTHDGRWDAVGSASIGVLLVGIAIVLAIEMKSLLVGESVSPRHQTAIAAALVGPGVASVIHLRTLHLGPEQVLVGAKIEIDRAATGPEIAEAIDGAEERVRAAVPLEVIIYLEPDLRRSIRA